MVIVVSHFSVHCAQCAHWHCRLLTRRARGSAAGPAGGGTRPAQAYFLAFPALPGLPAAAAGPAGPVPAQMA